MPLVFMKIIITLKLQINDTQSLKQKTRFFFLSVCEIYINQNIFNDNFNYHVLW